MPRTDADSLTRFATAIFEACNISHDVARQVAESLVLGNLNGHDSHGVIRIIEYVDWTARGWINPEGKLTVIREQPGILILDGDGDGDRQGESGRCLRPVFAPFGAPRTRR